MSSESPDGIGFFYANLGGVARMVAYLAMRQAGKVKADQRHRKERLRDAILGDCEVDEATGQVAWKNGVVSVSTEEDFEMLAKAVHKLFDDEGVEFDMLKGANELMNAIENKEVEIREAKKRAEAAAEEAEAEADAAAQS